MSPNSIYLLCWQGYYELNIDTSGQSRLHCRYAISLRVCIILPIHGELPTLSQPMHMAVESLLVILYYYNIIIVNIDKPYNNYLIPTLFIGRWLKHLVMCIDNAKRSLPIFQLSFNTLFNRCIKPYAHLAVVMPASRDYVCTHISRPKHTLDADIANNGRDRFAIITLRLSDSEVIVKMYDIVIHPRVCCFTRVWYSANQSEHRCYCCGYSVNSSYETSSELMIVMDLHCTELLLAYKHVKSALLPL